MRDDRDRAPNGRPRPRLNGVPGPTALSRVLPDPGTAADAPVDLVAVQVDDELVSAIGARTETARALRSVPAGGDAPRGGDDRLTAMLAAWRAEIDAEPIPELIDLDDAVAAVLAGVAAQDRTTRHARAGRLRQLAPLVAAAAIIVATVTGVGLGSQNAVPGDTLWSVQKVVNPERAESVEAKVEVESHLEKVRTALQKGDTVTAAQELETIRTQIPVVRGQEGQPQLVQEQEFLAAKLADTPPGTPADLGTPARSNPGARPTGSPSAPPPAPAVPPSGSAAASPSASEEPGTPKSTGSDPRARPVDPALVPESPTGSRGGEPAVPPVDKSAPEATTPPSAGLPEPNPEKKTAPPVKPGGGAVDGTPVPQPVPQPVPDVPPGSGDGAPPPADAANVPSTTQTATASGSAGASVETTATDTTTS